MHYVPFKYFSFIWRRHIMPMKIFDFWHTLGTHSIYLSIESSLPYQKYCDNITIYMLAGFAVQYIWVKKNMPYQQRGQCFGGINIYWVCYCWTSFVFIEIFWNLFLKNREVFTYGSSYNKATCTRLLVIIFFQVLVDFKKLQSNIFTFRLFLVVFSVFHQMHSRHTAILLLFRVLIYYV